MSKSVDEELREILYEVWRDGSQSLDKYDTVGVATIAITQLATLLKRFGTVKSI